MLGLIFVAPFLVILVVFTLSNMDPVRLAFWPTDLQLEVPLSLAVLGFGLLFFLLGALVVWIGAQGPRRRAKRAESRVRALEGHIETLRREPGVDAPVCAPVRSTDLMTIRD